MHSRFTVDPFATNRLVRYREWYDEGSDDEELLNSPALRKIWSKVVPPPVRNPTPGAAVAWKVSLLACFPEATPNALS